MSRINPRSGYAAMIPDAYIFTLAQLMEMPTLHSGHFDNLKHEDTDKRVRVYLSRMTVEDGAPFDNEVSVQMFDDDERRWVTIGTYQAQEG